ncbi:MAG TPA: RnfABCDGE type electron transport complex subunit G [Candidatus Coprenecus pullistercoris]|nr:RnfABCDGE type electron transport complex subunit G [Candidatus Coprenecus pullistercoris]
MPKKSTLRSMVLCLTLVCLVCSALLGGVYVLTKDKIAMEQIRKTNDAISLVFPSGEDGAYFDNQPSSEVMRVALDGDSVSVYPAEKNGELVGYAVESSTSKGFNGTIVVMVGFDADGNIMGTSVISHSETPGLGSKMTEPSFSSQFVGRNPASFRLSVSKDGGDVDAITASTITSRAYCDALDRAWRVYQKVVNDNSK